MLIVFASKDLGLLDSFIVSPSVNPFPELMDGRLSYPEIAAKALMLFRENDLGGEPFDFKALKDTDMVTAIVYDYVDDNGELIFQARVTCPVANNF